MASPYKIFLPLFLLLAGTIRSEKISDMGRAIDYCLQNPLDRIEGIYEFPEDNMEVLVRLADQKRRRYEIIVITTPDCRLAPGEKIGEMTGSIDPDKFHLSLYTSRKAGLLSDPGNCLAEFDENDGAIRIEKRKLKISTRVSRFLPKFWRILSLFSIDDPTGKLPKGLIRIFPNPYNDNIERAVPRYL